MWTKPNMTTNTDLSLILGLVLDTQGVYVWSVSPENQQTNFCDKF